MTKIKSINPNQLYIAQNAEVSLKLAGNTAQVTFTAGKNKKCSCIYTRSHYIRIGDRESKGTKGR